MKSRSESQAKRMTSSLTALANLIRTLFYSPVLKFIYLFTVLLMQYVEVHASLFHFFCFNPIIVNFLTCPSALHKLVHFAGKDQ